MSAIYSPDVMIDNPVSVSGGTISVDNFPATQPVNGTVSVGNFPATQNVAVTNTVSVITAVAASATLTITPLPTSTDTMILAANASRKSAVLFIPKAGTSIKYGSGSSASSFTFLAAAANTTIIVTGYTGVIHAFGPAQSINATELV